MRAIVNQPALFSAQILTQRLLLIFNCLECVLHSVREAFPQEMETSELHTRCMTFDFHIEQDLKF